MQDARRWHMVRVATPTLKKVAPTGCSHHRPAESVAVFTIPFRSPFTERDRRRFPLPHRFLEMFDMAMPTSPAASAATLSSGCSPRARLLHCRLPAAAPSTFAALLLVRQNRTSSHFILDATRGVTIAPALPPSSPVKHCNDVYAVSMELCDRFGGGLSPPGISHRQQSPASLPSMATIHPRLVLRRDADRPVPLSDEASMPQFFHERGIAEHHLAAVNRAA